MRRRIAGLCRRWTIAKERRGLCHNCVSRLPSAFSADMRSMETWRRISWLRCFSRIARSSRNTESSKQLCLSPSYIGLVPTAPIVSSIYARVFRLQVWVRRVLLGVSGLWSGFASYNQDLGAISGKALGLRWFASHLGVAREVASVIRGLNINA